MYYIDYLFTYLVGGFTPYCRIFPLFDSGQHYCGRKLGETHDQPLVILHGLTSLNFMMSFRHLWSLISVLQK